MAFDTLVRSGVALANSLTQSLQSTVQHQVGTADGRGKVTLGAAVARGALVEKKTKTVIAFDGNEQISETTVTILARVAVGQFDRITLPDGTYGPILSVSGLMDPTAAGGTYLTQVFMGRSNA